MKLRLISEELYLDHNKTTIDVVEAENGVHLITAYVGRMDHHNVLHPVNSIRCVVNDELYSLNPNYAIDAFKLLFTDPSFKGRTIRFNDDNDDNSIVDDLVARRVLVRVDGGFVLGSGNKKADYLNVGGSYRATNIKSAYTKNNQKQDLVKAVAYHAANYGGKRWPELELLFTQRAETFVGGAGDYVKPRLSLYKYLNNINERWTYGESLANTALKNHLPKIVGRVCQYLENIKLSLGLMHSFLLYGGRYFRINNDVLEYVNGNDEAQKIVAKIGLKFYKSIASGLLSLEKTEEESNGNEFVKPLFNDIMTSWIGRVMEITQKFYKVPDLSYLADAEKHILMKIKLLDENQI